MDVTVDTPRHVSHQPTTDEQLLIQLEATLKALEQQPHTQRHALLLKVCPYTYWHFGSMPWMSIRDGHIHPPSPLAVFTQVADTAYTAGVAKIQAGQPAQAQQLLQLAAAACPESKVNARRKIQQALNTCRGGGGGGGAA